MSEELNGDEVLKSGEETIVDSEKLEFNNKVLDELKVVEDRTKLELMTEDLKSIEPKALLFNAHFKSLISKAIEKLPLASTNGIIITGRPGIGKTYNIIKSLEEAKDKNLIRDYNRATGHVTPTTMLSLLKDCSVEAPIKPLFLDDCDFYLNPGNLELLKSALETRDSTGNNRMVKYNSAFSKNEFKFNGLIIIASNQNFLNTKSKNMDYSMHLDALKSRCHIFKLAVSTEIMKVNAIRMIEDFLNSPDGSYITPDCVEKIKDFVNNELIDWMDKDLFTKTGLGFDMRIIKKMIDCIFMYEDEWKIFSTDYVTLKSHADKV